MEPALDIKTHDDKLFIGMYPGGIVYADRTREEHGDYMRVAFLPYGTLELQVNPKASPALVERAKADAALYKAGDTLYLAPYTITLGQ